jgi:hypothetical protein
MERVMNSLQITALLIVAAISTMAVFHHLFEDTLTQRIGLSMLSFGAVMRSVGVYYERPSENAVTLLAIGLATYLVGTLIKFHRIHKAGRTCS